MKQHRWLVLSLLSLLALLAATLPVAAQIDEVSISGTVTDPSGATVSGAKISLLLPATGLRREAVTDSSGMYHFPALQIGNEHSTRRAGGIRKPPEGGHRT